MYSTTYKRQASVGYGRANEWNATSMRTIREAYEDSKRSEEWN